MPFTANGARSDFGCTSHLFLREKVPWRVKQSQSPQRTYIHISPLEPPSYHTTTSARTAHTFTPIDRKPRMQPTLGYTLSTSVPAAQAFTMCQLEPAEMLALSAVSKEVRKSTQDGLFLNTDNIDMQQTSCTRSKVRVEARYTFLSMRARAMPLRQRRRASSHGTARTRCSPSVRLLKKLR